MVRMAGSDRPATATSATSNAALDGRASASRTSRTRSTIRTGDGSAGAHAAMRARRAPARIEQTSRSAARSSMMGTENDVRAAPRMTPAGSSDSQWICRAVAIALVVLLLASVARLYHPLFGFTEMIGFASDGTGELPALQAIPHYRHPPWGSYDGQFYAQLALEPLLRDPAIDQRPRSAAVSRPAHPLQLDRVGARPRPTAMDPAGLRAAERARLAASSRRS